jgi:putative Mg2+ transporter-C (MgtC) family protein
MTRSVARGDNHSQGHASCTDFWSANPLESTMDSWWAFVDSVVPLEPLARLLAASIVGALIGFEREARDKPAGLRTHMMVALGAAAFMVATIEFSKDFMPQQQGGRVDPTRVAGAIIGGIGFLGAGTIIQARGSVRGITTAASIWVAAALGVACGMGMFRIAVMTVVLALVILTVIGFIEPRMFPGNENNQD